jgi:hypothetical protein
VSVLEISSSIPSRPTAGAKTVRKLSLDGWLLSPEVAALSMSGATLIVVTNALLLKRVKIASPRRRDTRRGNAIAEKVALFTSFAAALFQVRLNLPGHSTPTHIKVTE